MHPEPCLPAILEMPASGHIGHDQAAARGLDSLERAMPTPAETWA